MAWFYEGKLMKENEPWVDKNGVKHPVNWGIWSDDVKKSHGLVWAEPVNRSFDRRFWVNLDTPKQLEDLKREWKHKTNSRLQSSLQPSDYVFIRKIEDSSYEIPNSLLTYRSSLRDAAKRIKFLIDGAKDHESFVALFDVSENGKSPINDWPEKE